MSPHMQDTIKTPFFMFNSKYDASGLGLGLGLGLELELGLGLPHQGSLLRV
jgi:hypothetical protein